MPGCPGSLRSPEGHQPLALWIHRKTGGGVLSPLPTCTHLHGRKCLHLPKLPLPVGWPSAPLCQPTKSPGEIPGGQVSCSWLIQMERDQGQHSASPQEPTEPHAGVCAKLPCFLALHNPWLCPGASKHHGRTYLWEMSS